MYKILNTSDGRRWLRYVAYQRGWLQGIIIDITNKPQDEVDALIASANVED